MNENITMVKFIISSPSLTKKYLLSLRYDEEETVKIGCRLRKWFDAGMIDAGVKFIEQHFDNTDHVLVVYICVENERMVEFVERNVERALM